MKDVEKAFESVGSEKPAPERLTRSAQKKAEAAGAAEGPGGAEGPAAAAEGAAAEPP